jgi:hypothetical protein
MTPIERSNNLAQRNVAIEREPVTSPTFLFAVADTRRELIVDAKLDRDRRAFLHFPKTAARLWQNQGRRLVPPTQRTVPIRTGRRLRTTRTHIRPRATEAGADVAQLIVDSTDAGVPSASEFITVRQKGRSGFRIQLNRSGFRDSFEWGLARGWHATGRWNVVDRNVDRCALSRLGRRAAGFAGRRGCRLPSGRHDGNLTSPQFTVPRRRGPVGVTFFHRSSGPNAPGTKREVWIVAGRRSYRLRRWTGRDHLRSDDWKPVYLDLSRFARQRVRLSFRVTSAASARPPTWFVDDVAVN